MDSSVVHVLERAVNFIPDKDVRAKVSPRELVVAVVLGCFRDGEIRSLANRRLAMIALLDKSITRGAWWSRLAAKRLSGFLASLIVGLLQSGMVQLGIAPGILAALGVTGIYFLDSTLSSLPDAAAGEYPGPRNNANPAAVKCHVLWSLFSGAVAWHKITPGTNHDNTEFPPLSMLRGKLVIFDLGYWDFERFADLINAGVKFLSRVRSDAVVTIVEVVSGLPKKLVGRSLASITHGKANVVEVTGAFGASGTIFKARVIGFWNPGSGAFHWYTTNLTVAAALIYPLYRLRWQIELAFKACKTTLRLADFTTTNATIIRNLIMANIAAMLFAQPLARTASAEFDCEQQAAVSVQRAAKVVVSVALELGRCLIHRTTEARDALIAKMRLFAPELFDPNYRHRETSLARVMHQLE